MTANIPMRCANPGDWTDYAACTPHVKQYVRDKAADPDNDDLRHPMQMPDREKAGGKSQPSAASMKIIETARAICRSCSVIDDCFQWVMTEPDPAYGLMAAGMTTQERNRHRRERGIPVAGRSPLRVQLA